MLDKTQHHSIGSRARAQKSRERAVDFHVTIPACDDAVSRRLVRRIQKSIERTLAAETPDASAAARPREERTPGRTAPGCGAWWTF